MNLSTKDSVGILLVLGTAAALVLHNGPFGHASSHSGSVGDAGGSVTSPVGDRLTVFVDFNVVPMDEDRVLRNQIVVVRGSFIERIGRVGLVEPPSGALRIEGDGTRYLMPGLTDAHVHLRDDYEEWLPLFIANGVTTVFNLEGDESHLELRDRIWGDEQPGPTVYTAGPYVGEPEISTAAEAREEVERQAELGFDFVKVHGGLSLEAHRALTEAGRELGIPVIGHAPRNLAFSSVLEHGQVGISHAEEIIQTGLWTLNRSEVTSVANAMAAAGTWLTPTLSYFEGTAAQWASPEGVAAGLASEAARYLPARIRNEWRDDNPFIDLDADDRDDIQEMYEFHEPLLSALHQAGVPILAGTDAPLAVAVPGFSLHSELAALRGVGLSGYEALATATVNAGRFVESEVEEGALFGTLRADARADILMLEGDPRTDPALLRRPTGVMVRGRWYARAELDRMLTEASQGR